MSGSTRSYEAARRLVEWGHEVTMITTWREQHKSPDWFTTVEDGIEVHWIPVEYSNQLGFYRRLMAFFRFAFEAAKKVRSSDADVILASSTPLTIALPAIYARLRNGPPYVLEVRDLWPKIPVAMGVLRNPVAKWAAAVLERVAYRYASQVVALSPGMAEGVEAAGYPADCITVIPNGSDLELFSGDKDGRAELAALCSEIAGRKFILYPGTIGTVNGVDYLARLARAMQDQEIDLAILVVGEGRESDHVRKVAAELGVLEKNFFMRPPVAKHELAKIVAESSAVTSVVIDVPELEANSANKFFDALAAGKPILINHGGWQAEMIKAHGIGLVLSRDVEVAAKQLSEWSGHEENLINGGRAARQLAETTFDRYLLSRKLEAVLKKACRLD